ncbi:hypothetical protein Dsin_028106 [Dipteronia sinensis]|uniref:Uncharacterized protein n=1 Tax=Dipteronia sinensis TaxID=43782 RepID=A0AAE0DU37_9ROSI|nr:hypothetical protein Dsin_028106 [Dipteronia sinensis]
MGRRVFGTAGNVPSMCEQSSPTSIEECILEADKMESINTDKCEGPHDHSTCHALKAGQLESLDLGQVGGSGLVHMAHIDQSPLGSTFIQEDKAVGPSNGNKYVHDTKQDSGAARSNR